MLGAAASGLVDAVRTAGGSVVERSRWIGSLNDLVELAAVELRAAALRAVVDLDAP